MSDLSQMFRMLRRPSLLVRAARIAAASYQRDKDLRRILHTQRLPSPSQALASLLALEHQMEAQRSSGNATYHITRHVEILAALIAEASRLPRRDAA